MNYQQQYPHRPEPTDQSTAEKVPLRAVAVRVLEGETFVSHVDLDAFRLDEVMHCFLKVVLTSDATTFVAAEGESLQGDRDSSRSTVNSASGSVTSPTAGVGIIEYTPWTSSYVNR